MCAVQRMMCRWLTVQPPVTPASNCGIAAVELYSIIPLETRSFSKGSHNLHFYFSTAYGFTCKHILNYVRCDGAATAFSIEQKRALHSFVEREQCGNLNKATSTENRSVKCSHALSEREWAFVSVTVRVLHDMRGRVGWWRGADKNYTDFRMEKLLLQCIYIYHFKQAY